MANHSLSSDTYKTAEYFQCNLCDAYLIKGNILQHVYTDHCGSQSAFICRFCAYSGHKKFDLLQHQRDFHRFDGVMLTCPLCGTIEEELVSHVQKIHFSFKRLFICRFCSFKTENAGSIKPHIYKVHYKCKYEDCRTICHNAYELFSHYIYHYPSLTLYYDCAKCDYGHTDIHSLYQHQRDKHGLFDETYDGTTIDILCQKCSYKTDNTKSFSQHIKAKRHRSLYICPFKECTYESFLFWSFTEHVADLHLSETIGYYVCFECEKFEDYSKFRRIGSLIQHLRDKHGIIDECPQCSSYEENLVEHISDHDDFYEEYLSCRLCNEEFEEKDELFEHLLTDHFIYIPMEVRLLSHI